MRATRSRDPFGRKRAAAGGGGGGGGGDAAAQATSAGRRPERCAAPKGCFGRRPQVSQRQRLRAARPSSCGAGAACMATTAPDWALEIVCVCARVRKVLIRVRRSERRPNTHRYRCALGLLACLRASSAQGALARSLAALAERHSERHCNATVHLGNTCSRRFRFRFRLCGVLSFRSMDVIFGFACVCVFAFVLVLASVSVAEQLSGARARALTLPTSGRT